MTVDGLTRAQCLAEIKSREAILPTLVGWLYTRVVSSELDQLRERVQALALAAAGNAVASMPVDHWP